MPKIMSVEDVANIFQQFATYSRQNATEPLFRKVEVGCLGKEPLYHSRFFELKQVGVERLQLTLYGLEETHDQFARI